jgi:hypothetical protein
MDENQRKEEIKNNICNYLKQGMYKKDSAILVGISEATFYRWTEEDKGFESRVEASILEYKHSLVKIVNACAEKDGRLALEVLRRRFPDIDARTEEAEEHDRGIKQIVERMDAIIAGDQNKNGNEKIKEENTLP